MSVDGAGEPLKNPILDCQVSWPNFLRVHLDGARMGFLGLKLCKNLKILNIMALVLQIFPFANAEIVTAAVTCIFMTLFGLSLGFALLKVQGE